jgi:hypothetical protein
LGQSLSYLQKHTYSGLIVPEHSDDNFRIAEFIKDTLVAPEFEEVPLSLFAYNPDSFDLSVLHPIVNERTTSVSTKKHKVEQTFWSWWRDISHYELLDLLNLSFKHGEKDGDIYSDWIYPEFHKRMLNGETKQWEGTPRKKTASIASEKSEKQNSRIPLVHLGLWTSSECRLTPLGFELLQIGRLYGAGSKRFVDKLAYIVLVNGRHLELINIISECQKVCTIPELSGEYSLLLDDYLTGRGCIGKRKPTAVKTGAKKTYFRDESKLWNKLGLLEMRNDSNYFFPGEGFRFNWERITNLLLSGN